MISIIRHQLDQVNYKFRVIKISMKAAATKKMMTEMLNIGQNIKWLKLQ